jgi:hypothetical protein
MGRRKSLSKYLWPQLMRLQHVHHPIDILAGSLLGSISATVFYLMYWPAPWSADNLDSMAQPRLAEHLDEARIALGRDDEEACLPADGDEEARLAGRNGEEL